MINLILVFLSSDWNALILLFSLILLIYVVFSSNRQYIQNIEMPVTKPEDHSPRPPYSKAMLFNGAGSRTIPSEEIQRTHPSTIASFVMPMGEYPNIPRDRNQP
jgi:hypothetical protein